MNSRVLVALRIAADRDRVFEAFTREIHLWWRPHPMFLFSRRTGGKLAIEPQLGERNNYRFLPNPLKLSYAFALASKVIGKELNQVWIQLDHAGLR